MQKSLIPAALALLVPLGALSLGSAAYAQQASTADFVENVAISDMFEIESGHLAAKRAKSADVKSFAERMVADHTKTSQQLKELVESDKIKSELPKSLDEKHQAKLDKLKDLSGAKFDAQYVPQQVDAHERAVALFDRYADSGDNAELKAWAQKTLPTLKDHMAEAKQLRTESNVARASANDDKSAERKAKDVKAPPAKFDYVTRQTPTDWTAEALIGRTVENTDGENLGDINNVVLNEKGRAVAVVIGVGGFLGIGEKDVGVPFDALAFRPDEQSATDAVMSSDSEADQNDREQPTSDEAMNDDATTSSGRFDAEHENIRIVLNASREQLEAAPSFVWLGEQGSKAQRGG